MGRFAEVKRDTKETQIRVRLDLDGAGRSTIATGVGFFDHMLDSFARHGGFDLEVETRGDLHILFGVTNVVHLSAPDAGGGYRLEHVVEGDRVGDVLSYVEYDKAELVRRVRQTAERAVRAGRLTFEQSAAFMRRYEEGLAGYTYLEDID